MSLCIYAILIAKLTVLTGLCLFAKRLENGKFVWPPIVDGSLKLTPAQLALLIEGIDWRRTVSVAGETRPSAV